MYLLKEPYTWENLYANYKQKHTVKLYKLAFIFELQKQNIYHQQKAYN